MILLFLVKKKRKNSPEWRSRPADPQIAMKNVFEANNKPEKSAVKEKKSWFAKNNSRPTPSIVDELNFIDLPLEPLNQSVAPPPNYFLPPQVAPPPQATLNAPNAGLIAVQMRSVDGSFAEDTQSLIQARDDTPENRQIALELAGQPQTPPTYPAAGVPLTAPEKPFSPAQLTQLTQPQPIQPTQPTQPTQPFAPVSPLFLDPAPVASQSTPLLDPANLVPSPIQSAPVTPPTGVPTPVYQEPAPRLVFDRELPKGELTAAPKPVQPQAPQTVELTVAPVAPVAAPVVPIVSVEPVAPVAPVAPEVAVVPVSTVQSASPNDVTDDLDDLAPPPPPRPVRVTRPDQTQLISPIKVDQTQMSKPTKASFDKKAVTIQELDVSYELAPFMSSLEIVYYKLLRSALSQYLIFPHVICRSVVKAVSDQQEHQKIADNVLSGTSLSFIVCDVKLNIKAVVEVIDESKAPTNKDKARNYILKKVGFTLLRYYSGDKPPDTETIRRNILG
ncbi:MAG: DUF2726 domain-containing protein [Deltaproteobacteria bacterium]|nr:DUF2726 domain-containing protein [Deltaproteobacteria bacterium]